MNELIGVQIKSCPGSPERMIDKFPVIISINTNKDAIDK